MSPRGAPDVDALFAAPLDRFIAERDRIAKDLSAAGDEAAAKEVRSIRKPSVTAWTLNQMARSEVELLRELFGTGERIRRALEAGDQAEAREAQAARRTGLKEAGERARRTLEEAGHGAGSTVEKVRSILLQATTDDRVAGAITSGTLTKEPEADALSDVFGAALPDAETSDARPARSRRVEKLERRVEELRAEAEEAARRATTLTRDAESARIAADAAEETARAAERAAERALKHLDKAEAELRAARS